MRKVHYCWPDLGENVRYCDIIGVVESRNMSTMSFKVDGIDIKLEDFIVEEIREKFATARCATPKNEKI